MRDHGEHHLCEPTVFKVDAHFVQASQQKVCRTLKSDSPVGGGMNPDYITT
jgi:hypothetical protein